MYRAPKLEYEGQDIKFTIQMTMISGNEFPSIETKLLHLGDNNINSLTPEKMEELTYNITFKTGLIFPSEPIKQTIDHEERNCGPKE